MEIEIPAGTGYSSLIPVKCLDPCYVSLPCLSRIRDTHRRLYGTIPQPCGSSSRGYRRSARVLAALRAAHPAVVLLPAVCDERAGTNVFWKPENAALRTGRIKFRGAFNKLSSDPASRARRRRVAFSPQPRPGLSAALKSQHAGDHR